MTLHLSARWYSRQQNLFQLNNILAMPEEIEIFTKRALTTLPIKKIIF